MKYSIEIGKIVEGALKHDQLKVINYTRQLVEKLKADNETMAASKFSRMLTAKGEATLTAMGATKRSAIPIDAESRTALVDVIFPSDNNIELILTKNNADKLHAFILSYKNADKLNSLGLGMSNTLLLYGPPGCGKTKCAHLIAKELRLPLVVARLDSLISSYLGTTSKNIRTLFEFAQKMPCVLFLDEFDAIAKARDDSNELGELKRVVNSLLQNVDALSSDSLLLAATNHDKLLDIAIWRRFSNKLEIELPDIEAVVKMIDLFTRCKGNFTPKEKKEMATAFLGISGADIEEIITKSLRNSIIFDTAFSKHGVYEEFFIFKNILPQICEDKKKLLELKAKYLRACNDKVFSLQVIADILGSSKTTIQKLVKEEGNNEQ